MTSKAVIFMAHLSCSWLKNISDLEIQYQAFPGLRFNALTAGARLLLWLRV